jgi:hypothetical protein
VHLSMGIQIWQNYTDTDLQHCKEYILENKEHCEWRLLSLFLIHSRPKNIIPVFKPSTVRSKDQGVAKRCRLSLLTNSAFVYEPKGGGRGGVAGSQPMSTVQLYTGAQINFGDLTPHLTYGKDRRPNNIGYGTGM